MSKHNSFLYIKNVGAETIVVKLKRACHMSNLSELSVNYPGSLISALADTFTPHVQRPTLHKFQYTSTGLNGQPKVWRKVITEQSCPQSKCNYRNKIVISLTALLLFQIELHSKELLYAENQNIARY